MVTKQDFHSDGATSWHDNMNSENLGSFPSRQRTIEN